MQSMADKATSNTPDFMEDKSNELLCKYCKKPIIDHYKRDKDGKIIRVGAYGSSYIQQRCTEEIDQILSECFYDDILRRGPTRPQTSPLNKLYSKNELGEGIIPNAFIVCSYADFLAHFKAFIKHVTYDNKDRNMRFRFLDVVDLRTVKLTKDGGQNFSKFNEDRILIVDLGRESYNYVTDIPFMKELMSYRERTFLPLWFISQHKAITNVNVNDPEIVSRIQAYQTVDLTQGSVTPATTPVEVKNVVSSVSAVRNKTADKIAQEAVSKAIKKKK